MDKAKIYQIRTLIAENKLEQASTLIRKYLNTEPNNPEILFLRGVLAMKRNNDELAEEFITKAISIDKKPEYLKYIALIRIKHHKINEALSILKEVIKAAEKDIDALIYAAYCELILNIHTAHRYILKALEIDREKTKKELIEIYRNIYEVDPYVDAKTKERIRKEIEAL